MARDDDDYDWRFDLKLSVFFAAAAFLWQALQGQYTLGVVLFVTVLVLLPIFGRFRDWSIRSRRRTAKRAAAWARANPTASKRLRWVVFPLIGLLWALILWGLFA